MIASVTKPVASTANSPSTPHQRLYARTLLREQELPVNKVTVMHRDLFARAGIEWKDGADLDGTLCACTRAQISRLIDQLREDDGDE